MTMMHRRHFLCAATLTAGAMSVSANVALAQQNLVKPEVKLSEAKPLVMRYVENMSQASKELTGVEFTSEQKIEMRDAMITKMKDQDIYMFVDP
jgi:hypothetical protein